MSKETMTQALEALEAITVDVKSTPTAYEAQRQAINALREALAEQSAPVVTVQHKPTTYTERFTHAVAVLCGAQPPAEMIAEWFEDVEVNGGHRLQSWVGAQHATPSWAQCIVVLDAAHVLADDPEEGEGHETVKLAEQPVRTLEELYALSREVSAEQPRVEGTLAPEIAIADAYRAGVDSGIAAEREACARVVEGFARKWWKIHCDSNKHLETTLKAHQDFCALQAAIRARGKT